MSDGPRAEQPEQPELPELPEHDEMTRFVHALAERVPDADPPLVAVLVAARSASGRRSRWRAVVVGVAVAASIVAVAIVPVVLRAHHVAAPPAAPPAPAPVAPAGMKLVGTDGYAVAIPEDWGFRPDDGCPATTDSYGFVGSSSAFRGCRFAGRVSSLTLGSVVHTEPGRDLHTFDLADGRSVTTYEDSFRSSTEVVWEITSGDRTEEVSVVLTGADRGLLDTVAGSLQSLPAGWTTVPEWTVEDTTLPSTPAQLGSVRRATYLRVLTDAGLVGRFGARTDPTRDVRVTSPAQGAVVPAGSEVLLGSRPQTPPAAPPVAPAGTRLVGANGVMVAVPDSWRPVPQPVCSDPAHDSFTIATRDTRGIRCPFYEHHRAAVVTLATGSALDTYDDPRSRPVDLPQLPGVQVLTAGPSCARGQCFQTWLLPDQRLGVVAQTGSRGALSAIGANLRPVPDGSTTVPAVPGGQASEVVLRSAIERSGLTFAGAGNLQLAINTVHFAPAPASVVPRGSTVRVSRR